MFYKLNLKIPVNDVLCISSLFGNESNKFVDSVGGIFKTLQELSAIWTNSLCSVNIKYTVKLVLNYQ